MPSQRSDDDPDLAAEDLRNDVDPSDLAAEDFYLEGPYLILTAAFLHKRGFCCHSGCRHCPFG